MAASPLSVQVLGRIGYREASALQRRLVRARQEGEVPDQLLLLEHPAVITVPARSGPELLLSGPDELAARGIELQPTDRGGLITYHGPGQLVIYPILALPPERRDLHRYLRDLEEALIATVAELGVHAARAPGRTGVWVGGEKLAALGVRASRWVTSHGAALNVSPDLDHFGLIVPCGLRDAGVTSLARLLGDPPDLWETGARFVTHFRRIFDCPGPVETCYRGVQGAVPGGFEEARDGGGAQAPPRSLPPERPHLP